MVDWLRLRMVRDVSGAWLLPKNAPVRASDTAPSTAKTSRLGFVVISGATPDSVRTPRMRPLRSTMLMIASLLADAAAARRSSVPAAAAVSTGCGASFGGVGRGLLTATRVVGDAVIASVV